MEDFVWVEKYRPQTIEDTILPKETKKIFKEFIAQNNVPNLLLTGTQGTGKTTAAKALLNEIGADYIVINGSMDRNIDTLRIDIKNFASTVSFSGGRKYVILDEADNLNAQSMQPALRNFMEEYSRNCGFILTCNFKNKIIAPLHSRCSVVEFRIPNSEKPVLAGEFMKRVCEILDLENVEYDKKTVAALIQSYFPDWRRMLNELQRYSATGKIDMGILNSMSDASIEGLFKLMKDKKFTEVRKWVGENNDMESSQLYRSIYDRLPEKLSSASSIADAIIILAQYQYQEAFVANPEINRVAALATIMAEADWK